MLLGAGRSGTTWVGSLLARRYHARSVFEPFHPGYVDLGALPLRPVLGPSSGPVPYHDAMAAVIDGRVRSSWTDFGNKVIGRVDRRIIKEIRVCAAAGYIATHFPRVPLLGLVRNPLDNAASRRRLGWPTSIDHEALRKISAVHPDVASRFESASTDIGKHVGIWLMDTVALLRGLNGVGEDGSPWTVMSYETLVDDVDLSLIRIDEFTGWKPIATDVPVSLAPRPTSHGQRVVVSPVELADVSRVLVDFVDTSDRCRNYARDLSMLTGVPIG